LIGKKRMKINIKRRYRLLIQMTSKKEPEKSEKEKKWETDKER
jgi:hypothetical protein